MLRRAIGVASLGVLALAAAGVRSDAPEKNMATTARITPLSPAIDRRAPAKTETATFALG